MGKQNIWGLKWVVWDKNNKYIDKYLSKKKQSSFQCLAIKNIGLK